MYLTIVNIKIFKTEQQNMYVMCMYYVCYTASTKNKCDVNKNKK